MAEARDLYDRLMVLADVRAGLSARAAAARRGVAPATASRWARAAATGVKRAGPPGGHGGRKLGLHGDWLRAEVAARPRVTLAALQTGLAARGCAASLDTIWRWLREQRLGVGERAAAGVAAQPRSLLVDTPPRCQAGT